MKCSLCQNEYDLRDSHAIPKFVGKYLKESSVTGRIRLSGKPNLPVQDFEKYKLFCADCEQVFSVEEKWFAENIFVPHHAETQSSLEYDYHLGRFCSLQAYRTLVVVRQRSPQVFNALRPSLKKKWKQAEEFLRVFALSGGRTQREYSNHLLFLSTTESVGGGVPDLPECFNRYCIRAVDLDVPSAGGKLFVYSKMCRIALLTFISPRRPNGLSGTKVSKDGAIGPPQIFDFPGLGEYFLYRATALQKLQDGLSEKQIKNINSRFASNKDKIDDSEWSKAVAADIELQGQLKAHKKEKHD